MVSKVKVISLSLNVILIVVVILLLKQCHCPTCVESTKVIVDTIRPKDISPKVILNKVPVPVKSIPKAKFIQQAKSVLKSTDIVNVQVDSKVSNSTPSGTLAQNGTNSSPSPCDTINIYSDTIQKPDTCTFIINDTVEGRILGRSILYANLQPMVRTTIEKTLKEKWKVYIGGAFTVNAMEFNRWGVGVTGALAVPKIGMVDYTYDIRNNTHTIGVLALIRFKK